MTLATLMVSRHTGHVSSRLDSSSALGCLAHRVQQKLSSLASPQLLQAPQFLLEREEQLGLEVEARQEEKEGQAAEQEEGVEGAGEEQGQAGRQKSQPGYQVGLFQMCRMVDT